MPQDSFTRWILLLELEWRASGLGLSHPSDGNRSIGQRFLAVFLYDHVKRIMRGEIFGKDFEQLETAWKKDLGRRYSALEGAEDLAQSYRTKTPVAYWKVCRAGVDF